MSTKQKISLQLIGLMMVLSVAFGVVAQQPSPSPSPAKSDSSDTPPDQGEKAGDYTAIGSVEFGYTIFPDYRGKGYASEAAGALMDWATREHGVTRFVVSISPTNEPSLRIAQKFDFRKVGTVTDPEEGVEDVFLREV